MGRKNRKVRVTNSQGVTRELPLGDGGILDLSRMSLVALGRVPAALRHLDVSWNSLRELPDLPGSLETLNASHNDLREISWFPDSLKKILLSFNRNLVVKCAMPSGLIKLDLSHTSACEIVQFPASIVKVNLLKTRLAIVPVVKSTSLFSKFRADLSSVVRMWGEFDWCTFMLFRELNIVTCKLLMDLSRRMMLPKLIIMDLFQNFLGQPALFQTIGMVAVGSVARHLRTEGS